MHYSFLLFYSFFFAESLEIMFGVFLFFLGVEGSKHPASVGDEKGWGII